MRSQGLYPGLHPGQAKKEMDVPVALSHPSGSGIPEATRFFKLPKK